MMSYIRWDPVEERVIGSPANIPGPEDDWVRCSWPPRRKSRAQQLVWAFEDYVDEHALEGEQILVGSWAGSDDPGDAPVSTAEIRSTWLELMQYPVAANDGRVFQFDRDSRELIRGAITALTAAGITVDWRLDDNTTVTVNAAQLQAYYDELEVNQALRGLTLDQEYMALKANGATRGQLRAWCESHMPGA